MTRPDNSSTYLASLSTDLLDAQEEEPTVRTIVTSALEVVPDAQHVSLTMRTRRGGRTLAATSNAAKHCDHLQYALAEGPCLEASEDEEWFRSGDLGSDPRWPRWGPQAAEAGMRSALCVRLFAGGETLGALNMYGECSGSFADQHAIDFALLYAVHAANALRSVKLVTGLQTAMNSRHMIGVAQGILMTRYHLDLPASFNLLCRLSSRRNVKLRDLAHYVTEHGDLPPQLQSTSQESGKCVGTGSPEGRGEKPAEGDSADDADRAGREAT